MEITEAEIQARVQENARYEELVKFAKWHLCTVCNGLLVVRWWQGAWEIKCGRDKVHEGFKSWRERKRIGGSL